MSEKGGSMMTENIVQKKYKFNYQINTSSCMACAACEAECLDGAVFIDDSVHYAIDQERCIRCGKCFRACPIKAIERIMND